MKKNSTPKQQINASVTAGVWGLNPGFTQISRIGRHTQQGSRIGKQRVVFGRTR